LKLTAAVLGRTQTQLMARGASATVVALAMLPAFAAPAHAAGDYVFTRVASTADGFNPETLEISCPSINNPGDIAFKSERATVNGTVDGIYRANTVGDATTITPIFEVVTGGDPGLASGNPSMNDSGQVAFEARPSAGVETILRGDGTTTTTIATTSTQRRGFDSFHDNSSINNSGEVAFDGQLGSGARGLFSGTGGATTTHYLNTEDVSVEGNPDPVRFRATEDRPSINNLGDIAFLDEIQGTSRQDIFRGQEESFTTISASDPPSATTPPLLNDLGTVAWQTSFLDETGLFASAIVTGDGGPATRVVDSSGEFEIFHSYAINNRGAVAFSATLDSDAVFPSIYVGPDPKKDRVVGRGDKLDGGTVAGLNFCEEGLNDSGQLAFVAQIEDRNGDLRVGVFRATLRK
jgi:hypothetical protein